MKRIVKKINNKCKNIAVVGAVGTTSIPLMKFVQTQILLNSASTVAFKTATSQMMYSAPNASIVIPLGIGVTVLGTIGVGIKLLKK